MRIIVVLTGTVIGTCVVAVMYFMCASIMSEDAWAHYIAGGMFLTAPPDVSESGTSVVYSKSSSGHGDIFIRDLRTGEETTVANGVNCELSPRFAGNHNDVLFLREESGKRHLYLWSEAGRCASPLCNGAAVDTVLDLSCNGSEAIVLRTSSHHGMGKSGSVWLVSTEDPHQSPIELGNNAAFVRQGVVFATDQKPGEIFLSSENTKRLLLSNAVFLGLAAQRKLLVFTKSDTNVRDVDKWLWSYNVDSGDVRRLCFGHSPVIAQNGDLLYQTGFEGAISVLRAGQNSPEVVFRHNGTKEMYQHMTTGVVYCYVRDGRGSSGQLLRFDPNENHFEKCCDIP